MKNKIVKKILLVVVCVSVLVAVLVVPSFAYTWNNPTPQNNNLGYFNLPESSIVLKRNDFLDVSDDLPYYIYLPTSSNFSKLGGYWGGLTYQLNDGRESQFRFFLDTIYNTVYETGYYFSGYYRYNTTYSDFDYHLYALDSITYGDVWIMGQTSTYVNSIYNSLYLSIDCEPFYFIDGQLTDAPYVIAVYDITYIDKDGILQNETINTNLYLETYNNDYTDYYATKIYYLPESFNGNNVTYIESVNIKLFADSEIFCFVDSDDQGSFFGECGFTNRLVPSSVFNDVYYNNMIDNLGDAYYDDGYGTGYDTGYDEGLEVGREEGIDLGYDRGYDTGYNVGYDTGFDTGYNEGSLNPSSPFDSILLSVNTFLNWQFIPGVSFGIILSVVLGVSLLIIFLKVFAGG